MDKRVFLGVSSAALVMASCGGGNAEATSSNTAADEASSAPQAVSYKVDTENSVINWYNTEKGEKAHWGTVKLLSGDFTTEGDNIKTGSLSIDMNSITSDDEAGGERLSGHLMTPEFFDANQFATASFTLDKHEEGTVYGKLTAGGKEFSVTAPAAVSEGVVKLSDFNVDMSELLFFGMEKEEEKDSAKWHDPLIGFTASIVGKQDTEATPL